MTATLLRTDFNDFLFAPVGDDSNGMHLTLLSVLARSGVDPWLEAADLAALSRESATQKLISLLAGVPNGPPPGADTETVASRLVALLHAEPKPRAKSAGAAQPLLSLPTPSRRVKIAIYYLLALIALLLGNWALSTPHEPTPAGTSVPASR
jgi:hypothetical protein